MRVERSPVEAATDAGSAGASSMWVSGWILMAAGVKALLASPVRRGLLAEAHPIGAMARSTAASSVVSGAGAMR